MVLIIVGGLAFAGGVAVGDYFALNINKAIEVLKTAEASASATLAKITAHKAS